jgi:hypothetical protein
MARKKAEKKDVTTTVDVITKPVRLDLSLEDHRLLRKIAADADVSMAAYAREQLSLHLKEEAKRRGIKA